SRQVVTGTDAGSVSIWPTNSDGAALHTEGHRGRVNSLGFNSDGSLLLTGSEDQTARLWDPATGRAIGAPLEHPHVVRHVVLSGDGRTALTTSLNYTARLWNTTNGHLMHTLYHEGDLTFGALSPDGTV